MKHLTLFCLLVLCLYALDENDVAQEIQNAKTIEELSTQMQNAPRQYRHRYIQAIKERARIENEAKREQMMSTLNAEKNEDVTTQQINALTGRGSNGNSSSASSGACNGSGSGSGSGSGKGSNGGKGGGGKGGK
ncbi:hypothetical protein [Sulfurospirillum oryzae]|uniref:hypothetical protein n=1 Tax=Sulfurospirillum oryzae TaxID=2976535 RepID=UPI0021E7DFD1|nr:hypothetical protein [Sulfurospirillum oryzae]